MNKRDKQLINLSRRLEALGISLSDQDALRRIEMTLQRWGERECNGEIERDEKTGKTFALYNAYTMGGGDSGLSRRYPVPDKETGALKRLRAIMDRYPALWWYHQSDPRGCSLYVGKWDDLPGGNAILPDLKDPELAKVRETIDQHYTRGVAVCL